MPNLRFLPSGKEIAVPEGTRLIDAVRLAGLPIARACGDDLVCAGCGVRVLEGDVTRESPLEQRLKQRNRLPAELRLACAIRVHDDLAVHAHYWGPLD
jgi:ferredoxin